jgi:uncharacterized membrane protein
MLIRPLQFAAVVSLCLSMAAVGQVVTFQTIDATMTAMDMTPDGRFIVGITNTGKPYRFDTVTDEMLILPEGGNDATAISDDGTVIVGDMPDPGDGVEVAGMWTQATGWQSLGWLPDALNCPSRSNGYELSADGTVATGLSWDGCSGRAFVWTQATGMLELEPLANGGNRGSVISADGTVVGGFAQGSFNRTPARWDAVALTGDLLDPPNGDVVGEVLGMSDDGTVLLGNWDGDAYMWTSGGGVQVIGQGSVIQSWTGYAMDIADNGTIVGFDGFSTSRLAWIKPPGENELVTIANYVQNHGGSIPSGMSVDVCTRISADGRRIIGHSFFQTAWMVTIEPGCPGDIDVNGTVNVQDFLILLAAWRRRRGRRRLPGAARQLGRLPLIR